MSGSSRVNRLGWEVSFIYLWALCRNLNKISDACQVCSGHIYVSLQSLHVLGQTMAVCSVSSKDAFLQTWSWCVSVLCVSEVLSEAGCCWIALDVISICSYTQTFPPHRARLLSPPFLWTSSSTYRHPASRTSANPHSPACLSQPPA